MFHEPIELLWIGCLTGSIWTLKSPKTNLQTSWQKGISHVMSGTILFICSMSAMSALSAVLRISAWYAAPKRWRRGSENKKKITGLWQTQSQRRWTWPSLSRQESNNETRVKNLQSCAWFVVRQNQFGSQDSNPVQWHRNTRWQTYWQKDTSHVTNGIIFFVCSTSAISALCAAPRISACLAASPKGWRKGCKNYQRRTRLWRNPGQPDQFCSYKFFICEQSDCVVKPGGTQSLKSTDWMFRETWRKIKKKFQSQRSARMAKRMLYWTSAQGNMSRQIKTRNLWIIQDSLYRETCSSRIRRISMKPRNSRRFRRFGTQKSNLATSFMYHQTVYLTWSKSSRLSNKLMVEVRQTRGYW